MQTFPLLRSGPPRARSLVARTLVLAAVGGALTVAAAGTADAAPVCTAQNVALGRPATASSTENAVFRAAAAVDGDPGTRWSSAFSDPQWLTVDLGSTQQLCEVTLRWETAYGAAFRLKMSDTDTPAAWAAAPTVSPTTSGTGGTQVLPVSGSGRYLRLEGERRGTPWGYSLWELQARAQRDDGTDGAFPAQPATPDFGPNVRVFTPSTPLSTIQTALDSVFEAQKRTDLHQFHERRDALLFAPGTYGSAVGTKIRADLGYYTSVMGLGLTPDATTFYGDVTGDAFNASDAGNVTQNFWRSAENLAVVPSSGTNRWAMSQAVPFRRMHIRGDLTLGPASGSGFASGGYIADSRVDGRVTSGSQQQWYTRDSTLSGGWSGSVWNMVFSGVRGAPADAFPAERTAGPTHVVRTTAPRSREKPFLYLDDAGRYQVFVPALRRDAAEETWTATSPGQGSSLPMTRFFVTRPSDGAATMNRALAAGYNLLFTPGVYRVTEPIRVTRPDTVVLGMGLATLVPVNGVVPMTVADVPGVRIAHLLFDAGTTNSPVLLEVGQAGAAADHAANPTSLHDVFFRVGGAVAGRATTSLVVNSSDVILDHLWAWRGDHGEGIGWNVNTADQGVVVNGARVLATGLFVEHYQKREVVWNGEDGETIFFQNEKPYDVPDQASWRDGGRNGYAAYWVNPAVTRHTARGLGVYVYMRDNPGVNLESAIQVPDAPGVRIYRATTVALGADNTVGTISHVVNGAGSVAFGAGPAGIGRVRAYPAGAPD